MQKANINEDAITVNDFNDTNINDYTNIVCFGVDSRANELDKNTRSDSIIIMSIHKKTHQIKLASVYRDTYVSIQGHGYTKMTHAYAYGGPQLAMDTLNRNFDLNIKSFITVNFSALANMIDALGGVELNIKPNELRYVNAYTRDVARINGNKDFTYIKSPGIQTVSGTQATGYCRVRYTAGGDFARAERQRTVMTAIIAKSKKSNPIELFRAVNTILPQIYTNLGNLQTLDLAKDGLFYKLGEQQGFPFDKTTPTLHRMSVVYPRTLTSNVTKLHKFLFNTDNYTPSNTVKQIQSNMK